jgi:WD40 repeat protein
VALGLALLAGGQWRRAEQEVDARAAAEAVAVQERQAARSEADSRATAEALALEQREEALGQASVGLAAKALAELEGTAPERAVLLALEALEGYPYTSQAESALAQAVEEYVPYLALRQVPYAWAVVWSPDGSRIAGAVEDGLIIWDADSGYRSRHLQFPEFQCTGREVAWSPSGDRLVAVGNKLMENVGEDCVSPRVWSADSASWSLVFTGHEGQANSVDWSPDGATILSAGADGTARIWDANTGDERLTLSGHAGSVNDGAWSPEGGRIVTAAADGTAKVWDVAAALGTTATEAPDTDAETGTELHAATLSGHTGALNGAAWSPDGDHIATAGADGSVQVWLLPGLSGAPGDTARGEIVFTLAGHSKEVRGVAWSPDGERIATSSADGTVRIWDAATGEELDTLHGLSQDLQNVVWSPSGERLVAGGGAFLAVWDVSRRPLRLSGHSDVVWDAQWSPDGGTIGTASYDGTARLWDAATGEELLAMEHPAGVRFFAWSPDGSRIVTTCRDGFARVWDTGSGELLVEVAPGGEFITVASWSPDGSRFAASRFFNDVVTIFDAATGDALTSWYAGKQAHRVPWSPQGDRIVTGGSAGSLIWDPATGKRLMGLGDAFVMNAAWSPDGGRIVLDEQDGRARVIDATSGEELLVFFAHSDDIWHATWSPDGTRIASGDVTGEVKVWDAASGDVVLSFRAPGAIWSVNWSPDGDWVAAGGDFNPPVVRRAWQSTEELVAYAKACCVSRELTQEERQQYALSIPPTVTPSTDKTTSVPLMVATVSMSSVTDTEANLRTFFSYMGEAAEQGAHLIVFPEVALQQNPALGRSYHQPTQDELDYVRDSAETVPGLSIGRVVEKAEELNLYVIFGMIEEGSGEDGLYNTVVLVGPEGILGKHRKMHLWDTAGGGNEHLILQPGKEIGVFDSPIGGVGLMISVDMHHYLGPRLADEGADLLVTVASWKAFGGGWYETDTIANATRANRWHVISNQVGSAGHVADYGHSRVVSPDGDVVADTGSEEGMVIVETDLLIDVTAER